MPNFPIRKSFPNGNYQLVDGAERCVNNYTEADRDLISAAIDKV